MINRHIAVGFFTWCQNAKSTDVDPIIKDAISKHSVQLLCIFFSHLFVVDNCIFNYWFFFLFPFPFPFFPLFLFDFLFIYKALDQLSCIEWKNFVRNKYKIYLKFYSKLIKHIYLLTDFTEQTIKLKEWNSCHLRVMLIGILERKRIPPQ